MSRDHRDAVIETLADSEYALARSLAVYREALSVAIEQPYKTARQLDHLRKEHRRLREEYRRLCGTILRDDRRAA